MNLPSAMGVREQPEPPPIKYVRVELSPEQARLLCALIRNHSESLKAYECGQDIINLEGYIKQALGVAR